MAVKMNIGYDTIKDSVELDEADFYQLATKSPFFIDKTELVNHFVNDAAIVSLITRPAKFGKTVNLSMLHHFLRFKLGESLKVNVFENLNIGKHKELCKTHQGKYAVMRFDFGGVTGTSVRTIIDGVKIAILDELYYHKRIITEHFPRKLPLLEKKMEVTQDANANLFYYSYAVEGLMEIYQALGFPRVVLLDEYDKPCQQGYSIGAFDKISIQIESFFETVFKSQYLSRAVIVGTTFLARESIFASWNNMIVFSVLRENIYSSSFGFTPEEVNTLVQKSGTNIKMKEIDEWYKGYHFGKHVVLSPWSIVNCLQSKAAGLYWTKVGEGTIFIEELIRSAGKVIKPQFDALLKNKSITKRVTQGLAYPTLKTTDESFWTFLVHSGYLDAKVVGKDIGNEEYELRVPNKEIRELLQGLVDTIFVPK